VVRGGLLRSSLAAIVLAIAFLACGAMAQAQITHANSGDAKLQDQPPSDPAGAVDRARKRVAAGDLPGAVKELAIYVAGHPKEIEPARYLGDLYYRQSDLATAERTYLAILKIAPNDKETHNRLGGIYAVQDRVPEAIDQFQMSLPRSDALGRLVLLHQRLGDLDWFTNTYRVRAMEHPSEFSDQYNYGLILRNERRPIEAIEYLQRALSLNTRACPALSELGSAYLDLNEVPKALNVLQRCLSLEPKNYGALVNVADAYIDQGQVAKSRAALDTAVNANPDGSEALVDIGYIEDLQGHWQSAIQYYLRAISLDPNQRDAYVNLGYDYDEHHLFGLAEAAFIKGLSIAPSDGRLHYLLGVTYAEQGKKQLARGEYERAKTSDEPEVRQAALRDLALLQRQS
jgi:protein O-GlcNAc transferase